MVREDLPADRRGKPYVIEPPGRIRLIGPAAEELHNTTAVPEKLVVLRPNEPGKSILRMGLNFRDMIQTGDRYDRRDRNRD